jgi:DNA-binding transcriptional LysR family regulator
MNIMHISRMDLNLFVVLETIYSEGNITRASQKLNLTQPAVSHALGRLRDVLKDPLFVRQGANMVATPFTRNIITPVRQALQTLELSVSEHQQFDPRLTERSFAIGLRDVFEAIALPALIQRLQDAAPSLEIASIRTDRRDIEAELTAGTLDLALDVPLAVSNNIRQQRIFQDRLIVLVRDNHPLIQNELDMKNYLSQRHVLVSSRRKGLGLEDFELHRAGQHRHIALRCQHYFAACRVVSQSDLLLTMPEQYARVANAQFQNRIFAFPMPTQPLDVHLYWHHNVDNDPANRWLREQFVGLYEAKT